MLITWWRKRTVSALRKIEFRSSWQHGGFFELAAICSGDDDGGDDDHVDGDDDDIHIDDWQTDDDIEDKHDVREDVTRPTSEIMARTIGTLLH